VIVLDASAVIAVFFSSDVHHDQATALLQEHASRGFTVHPITLAETLVGAARAGRISQVHRQIRTMGVEPFTPDSDEPLLIAELRANTGLKLPDCCVLATALALSAPLITFDDKLRRGARDQAISVIEPIE
jgi:predicted nucleic acid-binding protein